MSSEDDKVITLYDLATTPSGGVCWSPMVWRVRLILNYKRIPFKTHWVEFPDIPIIANSIGANPTTPSPDGSGTMLFTLPILVDPNQSTSDGQPTVLSDSPIIVKYLEEKYPQPRLIPEGTAAFHEAWVQFISASLLNINLARLVVPECPKILSDRGREYFIRTREMWFRAPIDAICPDREAAWNVVRSGLDRIASALDANGADGEGLSVIPGKVCYADFTLLSPLLWMAATLGEKEMEEVKNWNGGRWGRLMRLHADLLSVE